MKKAKGGLNTHPVTNLRNVRVNIKNLAQNLRRETTNIRNTMDKENNERKETNYIK